MKLEKRTPSGREKDEASVKLLAKLREQLYSSNVSTVRQSCLLYTSPSPRDLSTSRMPSSA